MRTFRSTLAIAAIFAASIVVGITASAEAKLYDFTFDGGGIDIDGQLVTSDLLNSIGGFDITMITGTVISGTVNGSHISGLVANPSAPNAAVSPDGLYIFNNVLFATGTLLLDNNGVLFNGPGGEYNIFTSNSTYILADNAPGVGSYIPGTEGTFTVTGVPELSTWAMMIIGFGGVGLQMRRRSNGAAATA
jgi:hypothetical protein